MHKLFATLLIIAVVVSLLVVDISSVFATIYSIDSGITTNGQTDYGWDTPSTRLVRWPTGRLHTVYAKQFGVVQEIYYAYSDDNGLNWTPVQLTNVGHNQMDPEIAMTSNGDLHVVWAGRGEGAVPNVYALKYLHYDYSAGTWDASNTLLDAPNPAGGAGYGDQKVVIDVDGNDNLYIAWIYNIDGGAGVADPVNLVKATFNIATEDWTWGSTEEVCADVYHGGSADRVDAPLSIAIDQDNNVGVMYSTVVPPAYSTFRLRLATGIWQTEEVLNNDDCETGTVMASISSGDTVWRHVGNDGGALKYAQKTGSGGAWTAYALVVTPGSSSGHALAQEHGTGGDTGNFYLVYNDNDGVGTDRIKYMKYTLGVGWGGVSTITTDNFVVLSGATKSLFPYTEDYDWHWNLPIQGFAAVYVGDDAGGWDTGNEYVNYYETAAGWTTSRPLVWTSYPNPTSYTYTRGNGTILMTGGYNCTVRGFQYGLTATPTWISSQGGTFGTGEYGWIIPGLTSGTAYYMRAYATNALGTGYGRWVGFLTAGGSGSYPAGGVIVVTTAATAVLDVSATINGNIVSTGTSDCTVRGFEWGEDATYGTTWSETAASWPAGSYSHALAGLVGGRTYHYRAIAYNASGWSYGADMTFTTATVVPDIDTLPATNISVYTAQLNSELINDGGEACDVRFQYYTGAGAWTDNETLWIPGYVTGNKPHVDITGLLAGTTYNFRVQARNSVGTVSGDALTFTTFNVLDLGMIENFVAIPSAKELAIELYWIKGNNTANTLIRGSLSDYPINTTDGIFVYGGPGNSHLHDDLTAGDTWYYSAWGYSDGNYTTVVHAMATVSMIPADISGLPTPDEPGNWFLTVNYTNLSGLPFYDIVNDFSDGQGMARAFVWVMLAILMALVVFLAIYNRSGGNITWAATGAVIVLCICAPMGLVAGWMALVAGLIAFGVPMLAKGRM